MSVQLGQKIQKMLSKVWLLLTELIDTITQDRETMRGLLRAAHYVDYLSGFIVFLVARSSIGINHSCFRFARRMSKNVDNPELKRVCV